MLFQQIELSSFNCCYSAFLHGSQCWRLWKKERQILLLEMGWLRKILGVSILQKLRNEETWSSWNQEETLYTNEE